MATRRLLAAAAALLVSCTAARDGSRTVNLEPFYYYRRGEDGVAWYALAGLFGREVRPEEGFTSLSLPFYHQAVAEKWRQVALFPLFSWSKEYGKEGHTALDVMGPLLRYRREASYYELHLAYPLFRVASGHREGLEEFRLRLLPLFSYTLKREPAGLDGQFRFEKRLQVLWPLYCYYRDDYGAGYKRVDVLWPIIRYTSGSPVSPRCREKTFMVLPVFGWGRYLEYDEEGNLSDSRMEFYLADPVVSYVRSDKDGLRLRLLGPVFYYERKPGGVTNVRLLAGLWRASRTPEVHSVHLWPFYGEVRRSQERRVWVLLGFFRYHRRPDGTRRAWILWFIPLGRRPQAASPSARAGSGTREDASAISAAADAGE